MTTATIGSVRGADETRYLTPADVAKILVGVRAGTLAMWRHEHKGPPYCKAGRRVYYPEAAFHAWLRSSSVGLDDD